MVLISGSVLGSHEGVQLVTEVMWHQTGDTCSWSQNRWSGIARPHSFTYDVRNLE